MKISLEEHGGWSAPTTPRKRIVDLNALDEQVAREGRALADRLLAASPLPQPANPHARDDMEFTIQVEDDTQIKSFTCKSLALTREFADLVSWLKQHSRT